MNTAKLLNVLSSIKKDDPTYSEAKSIIDAIGCSGSRNYTLYDAMMRRIKSLMGAGAMPYILDVRYLERLSAGQTLTQEDVSYIKAIVDKAYAVSTNHKEFGSEANLLAEYWKDRALNAENFAQQFNSVYSDQNADAVNTALRDGIQDTHLDMIMRLCAAIEFAIVTLTREQNRIAAGGEYDSNVVNSIVCGLAACVNPTGEPK